MNCSQCNHRGVRHTAVEFAMAAFERLAHIAKELRSARQNAERLSSGKRRKDAKGQVRAQHGALLCMQSAHHGACACDASQMLTTAPALRPPGARDECGAARCARGGCARHALDHLRSGVISCRCRGTRARACKCSPRRPVPPLPTGDLVPVPRHARGHPRRVHRFAWARSPRAPVLL